MIVDPSSYTKLREAAAETILSEIDRLLFHVQTPESGRLIETVFQLLPDTIFSAFVALVCGNERDELVRALVFTVAVRVAHKLGVNFNQEMISTGASSLFALVNCENLRRKGHMEYLWVNDIFTMNPKSQGFMNLTDAGKKLSHQYILSVFDGKVIQ